MITIGCEKLTEAVSYRLASSMKILYDIIVQVNRGAPNHEVLSIAARSLLQQIGIFCVVSDYIPEGITKDEFQSIVNGFGNDDQFKKVLMDPIVTVGLRNISIPIDTEVIYQIMYDHNYRFIPADMRPKKDFMNPPE